MCADRITSGSAKVPRLAELFLAFSTVSLSGFGGVLPWTRRMIVERRGWMTADEFNAAYSLCNFLPGPNIVNFSVVFGSRIAGPWGALVALFGLLGPPVALVLVFAALYAQFGEVGLVRRILGGIAPAAAGLMLATAGKMARPLFSLGLGPAPLVVASTILAIGILRLPLPWVVLAFIPLSIAAAWWWRR
jgi:chromate transporter